MIDYTELARRVSIFFELDYEISVEEIGHTTTTTSNYRDFVYSQERKSLAVRINGAGVDGWVIFFTLSYMPVMCKINGEETYILVLIDSGYIDYDERINGSNWWTSDTQERAYLEFSYVFSDMIHELSQGFDDVVMLNPKITAFKSIFSYFGIAEKVIEDAGLTVKFIPDKYIRRASLDMIQDYINRIKNEKLALESLKDLDINRANRLYNELVESGIFEEYNEVNENIMYVFPDGRMLGSRPYEEEHTGDKMRSAFHIHLYRHSSDKTLRPGGKEHPALDPELGKYYNLVVVSPMDDMNFYGTAGFILLNENVELTEAQQSRVEELYRFGYKFPESAKTWVSNAWRN